VKESIKKMNPLLKLESLGQSIWLDSISRPMLTSGALKRLIEEDGLSGVTSNPAIFEKAIAETNDYDEAIRSLAIDGKGVDEIYEHLVVHDIKLTADQLRPIYDRLEGRDGFVSLEVSPLLAHDTEGTVAEAHRLWAAVDRPNMFIKVPATTEGLPAIRRLISDGININITLLFGLSRYRQVVQAYLAGLEDRVVQGKPIDRVASVASFFLSRIDTMIDPILERKFEEGGRKGMLAKALRGEVAVSSAKAAYRIFKEIYNSASFTYLSQQGGRVQRLLWASTSTKNPAYSDVKYVEPLIGSETINTLPMETLRAYRDHGKPAVRLSTDLAKAERILKSLPDIGINLDQVTHSLEDEGVEKFIKPFDLLMAMLSEKRTAFLEAATH
jgi:transaldolase